MSLRRLILIIVFGLLAGGSAAAQTPAFIVVDLSSGAVLSDKDAGKPWYPASITKLMTAYVTFKALKSGSMQPSTPVLITANALKEPPSKMGFPVGTTMTLDNALKMMLVKSANDIAVAVAETVGGSEPAFVARMNAEARLLGMNSTHFENPNGLPADGHETTARDMAVLARALWTEFPEYRPLFGISAIRSGGRVLRTYNTLLERYRGATGMKTGFICSSGFNVVASATRNGRSLAAVVLGAENAKERTELAAKLLDAGFAGPPAGGAKNLAAFSTAPAVGSPVDMRDQVCKKRNKNEGEDEDDDSILADMAGKPSSLEPKRFFVMDPVEVTTLYVPPQPEPPKKIAKKKTKAIAAKNAKKKTEASAAAVLPKLRPDSGVTSDAGDGGAQTADNPAPKKLVQ